MRGNVLVVREGRKDKEFHFQNWFRSRLDDLGEHYDESGRNTYPDFKLDRRAEGYELKGLACPGRDADYDCNSQFPCGEHNGRQVFYVFGRYPAEPDGDRYPVLDLVVCHVSFRPRLASLKGRWPTFGGRLACHGKSSTLETLRQPRHQITSRQGTTAGLSTVNAGLVALYPSQERLAEREGFEPSMGF